MVLIILRENCGVERGTKGQEEREEKRLKEIAKKRKTEETQTEEKRREKVREWGAEREYHIDRTYRPLSICAC